jgi:TolA-binding protein
MDYKRSFVARSQFPASAAVPKPLRSGAKALRSSDHCHADLAQISYVPTGIPETLLDAPLAKGLRFAPVTAVLMACSNQRAPFRITRVFFAILLFPLGYPLLAHAQDRAAEMTMRGTRAEIAVTVRDSSGEAIAAPAIVKLYRNGAPTGQSATTRGQTFFILDSLGDYSVVVEAPGYKPGQKDISVPVAVKAELEVVLERDSSSSGSTGVPGRPLLAPKAREAFDKGVKELSENKLKDAEKHIAEVARLAPNHPDVLYIQGVLYLRQRNWTQAEGALEKATQIDPNFARAYAALGMALSNDGKYEAAIEPLQRSLQLDSKGSWEAQFALAKAYYHHQQFQEALKTSQEALTESHGAAPEIQLLVAQSLTAIGRYEDSAQTLREFIKDHGDRPEAATARRWLERLSADGKIRQN